jgi:hypothetical protein
MLVIVPMDGIASFCIPPELYHDGPWLKMAPSWSRIIGVCWRTLIMLDVMRT